MHCCHVDAARIGVIPCGKVQYVYLLYYIYVYVCGNVQYVYLLYVCIY